MRLVPVLACHAHWEASRGRHNIAIDDLAAALQILLDCCSPAGNARDFWAETCASFIDPAIHEIRFLLKDDRVPASELLRLAGILGEADRQVPRISDELEAWLARDGRAAASSGPKRTFWNRLCARPKGSSLSGIFLGPERQFERVVEAARQGESLALSEEFRLVDKAIAEGPDMDWMGAGSSLGTLKWDEREHRLTRGTLRILQAAALYRLGVRPPDASWPLDPCDLKPLDLDPLAEGGAEIRTRPMTFMTRGG